MGFAQKMPGADIPRLFKAGCPSDQTLENREGGAVIKEPRSEPFFLMAARYRACIRSAHVLLNLLTAPSAPERNGTIV
jgi:hypothetical protein